MVKKTAAKKAVEQPADLQKDLSVQTVRMDRDTVKALKYACIERGITQNALMLAAIRRDLGLE